MTEKKRRGTSTGRPTKYTKELGEKICDLVADGWAFNKACDKCGVTKRTGYNWLREYEEFKDMYTFACECRADDVVDSILSLVQGIDTSSEFAKEEIQKKRLEVYAMQWIAGKMRPKKYNDRLIVDHGGSIKHNVSISEMTDEELEAIAAGRSSGITGETKS